MNAKHAFLKFMNEEERIKYESFNKEISLDKENAIDAVSKLLNQNIDHLRTFSSTLLTINITVIGAVLVGLLTNQVFISKNYITIGLSILFIDAILTVYYSTFVLVGENKVLTNRQEFLSRTFTEVQRLLHSSFEDKKNFESFYIEYVKKAKNFVEEEKDKIDSDQKKSWSANHLYWLSTLFVLGLVLIVWGIFTSIPVAR